MTFYAHIVDVPAPPAVYDAAHAELLRRTAGNVEGLVVHLARATDTGFQVIEVWSDRAAYERAERDVVAPVLAAQHADGRHLTSDGGPGAPALEEFTVRGLVLPQSGTAL